MKINIGILLVALLISSVSCEFLKIWNQINGNRFLRVEGNHQDRCEIHGSWDTTFENDDDQCRQFIPLFPFYNQGEFNGYLELIDDDKVRINVNYTRYNFGPNSLESEKIRDQNQIQFKIGREPGQNCTMASVVYANFTTNLLQLKICDF